MLVDYVQRCPFCFCLFELAENSGPKNGKCPCCGFGYYFTASFTGSEMVYFFHWNPGTYMELWDLAKTTHFDKLIQKHLLLKWLTKIPKIKPLLKTIFLDGWCVGWKVGNAQTMQRTIDTTIEFNEQLLKLKMCNITHKTKE